MNSRINGLRDRSLKSRPAVSSERAELITAFYMKHPALNASVPIQRARAFQYVLENKSIYIDPDELIVGERGPGPKETPTYPELCLHSLEDLEMLHNRKKVPYLVPERVKRQYQDTVIPFWQGLTIREKIFSNMTDPWKKAYQAGVFTEFQEQRSPGHTVLGGKIYGRGFHDFIQDIRHAMKNLDRARDPDVLDKLEELEAMEISAGALIQYAHRHAGQLKRLAENETDPERKQEYRTMAEICQKVPGDPPDTFWEALQYYWFVHVGVITESNPWDAFNPGRLDQHLFPFYSRELEDGRLTRDRARELLQSFWIKFNNHPAPPKTGVTAQESSTYVDFALINLGGLKADNTDAVNELSYLILEVIEEMRLLQPSSMIQISKKNPDRFLRQALRIVQTGFGQPSVFNTDTIIQELVGQGKRIEDARDGGASGCVESGAFGRESYILTGYFNLPKVLEITLHNGMDPETGTMIGLPTGEPGDFECFGDLMNAFEAQLNHFINIKIEGNNTIERINAKYMPVPFLSLLIDDCISTGRDYNNGGARYNTSYIQGVGLGSLTDSLSAIQYQVFDNNRITIRELREALKKNFEGYDGLRNDLIHHTPKYGNDNDYADRIMMQVFEAFHRAVNHKPNTKGGHHRINFLPTTCHVYFGQKTGALPDGRKQGVPFSEGISPVQGADRNGPTAVIRSAGKIDHIRTGGTLLNQKFLPQVFQSPNGIEKLLHLIRSYFKMDGHHIQFNVVDRDTLKKARKYPDQYRDLIVRVAGYSDYFVDLTSELQKEIIRRTDHQEF